jgi:phage regulator Rha-like protein
MKTPELCGVFGKRRSAIRQSIRTLRNSGLSELNLTELEKNSIETQIMKENESYGEMRSKWHR